MYGNHLVTDWRSPILAVPHRNALLLAGHWNQCLRRTPCRSQQPAWIYRVGGDEFIAITAVEYEDEVKKLEKVVLFVDEVSDKYDVTFSLGKSFYDAKKELTVDEVIKISDELMYKNKKKYKDSLRDRYTGDFL